METTVRITSGSDRVAVLGPSERNLKMIREALGVHVSAREGKVVLSGDSERVEMARGVLEDLIHAASRKQALTRQQVLDLISEHAAAPRDEEDGGGELGAAWDGRLNVFVAGRMVRARTPNQQRYIDAIRDNDLVFGLGPAGTGKTYLAVAAAVHLLKSGRVKRIVLTRPAVEAGERLGFLPGDVRAKVNPYLRPLFDALNDMMEFTALRRCMESDVIEVSPLAFMRGRTLNSSFVILDEAQNATKGQMKMFLTRLGHGSKMVVTGDPSQTDLDDAADCGLVDAAGKLARTPGVGFVGFTREDVVRHTLVQRIIEAYGDELPARSPRRRGSGRGAPPERGSSSVGE
ncbi:MAG: PhoH family protein [Phycisphaeraceae bacterium]|nr:PhoH family protein [Phycisphaeraceae bacterium]